MADETGLDVAKEAAKVEKPKPPAEPPKEKAPLGIPEQKIVDRIDKDGDEDKVLQDLASDDEQKPAINVARVQSKAESAFSVVSQYGTTTKEAVTAAVTKQAERVTNLIRSEGGSGYWLEGIAGKAVVDQNGEIIVHQSKYPDARLRLATEYAASAAAISSLYTSTPDVQTLPPEAFRIEADDLSKQIDENGVYLPIPEGRTTSKLKTRFYSIPGLQVDFYGKPIPMEDRHVLIVQDEPLEGKQIDSYQSEGFVRTYTVNSLAEIRAYLPDIIEKQRELTQMKSVASTTETVSQQPPLETNYLTELAAQDDTPIFGGEIITPTARRVGETNDRPAMERGWLSAIVSANAKKELLDSQRQQNIQEIAQAAVNAGISREAIEEQLKTLGHQPTKAETSRPMPQTPYEQIARNLPLDEQNPPAPESFIQPYGNIFADSDNATLAGKVAANMYDNLVNRPDYKRTGTATEIIDKGKLAAKDFEAAVKEANEKRIAASLKPFEFGLNRTAGTDGFHFSGEQMFSKDHLFYFNKSKTHWKNPNDTEVRAYVTLSPSEIDTIQRDFTDLATQMYDLGIDFTAKASSPYGLQRRTDNMVFYIAMSDQAQASETIKKFLTERGIGQGHVAAATPSPQEGLSWAMEPDQTQNRIWHEVSGSSKDTSFNMVVATMAMPTYLDRLAEAQARKGNQDAADKYKAEGQRVKEIIAKYQPTA